MIPGPFFELLDHARTRSFVQRAPIRTGTMSFKTCSTLIESFILIWNYFDFKDSQPASLLWSWVSNATVHCILQLVRSQGATAGGSACSGRRLAGSKVKAIYLLSNHDIWHDDLTLTLMPECLVYHIPALPTWVCKAISMEVLLDHQPGLITYSGLLGLNISTLNLNSRSHFGIYHFKGPQKRFQYHKIQCSGPLPGTRTLQLRLSRQFAVWSKSLQPRSH